MTTVIKSLAKAASATTPPQINLPELPEEIWQEIFRWACDLASPQDAPKLLSFPIPLSKRVRLDKRMARSFFWYPELYRNIY
jgi:hypothetical protein